MGQYYLSNTKESAIDYDIKVVEACNFNGVTERWSAPFYIESLNKWAVIAFSGIDNDDPEAILEEYQATWVPVEE